MLNAINSTPFVTFVFLKTNLSNIMKRLLHLFAFLMLCPFAQAQDMKSKLPVDPNVTIGKLENGLTYYIRHNAEPKGRAEFYLVVDAGAILENPDQNGLAHFCEHMAFNGTKHFHKKQIINYLQSIGMKFGPEINAFTSHDVTAYMLQKVPVNVPQNIDTSLLILHDWASAISFEDEEIDNERGVIHEEWRTGRNAMERMNKRAGKLLYKDSKYAIHDVIGEIDIIDHFKYETIKSFYADWYRPDLQAVIVVGDIDVKVIEQKIKELFGKIAKRENARHREIAPVPDHKETLVAVETDKESPYTVVQIYYKHPRTENKGTVEDYRQMLMRNLYNQMMNMRLQEIIQSGNPPFAYAYTAYTSLTRSKDAYQSFAVTQADGVERAFEVLLAENQRVKQHGFVASELKRASEEMLKQMENQFNERNKRRSDQYVWEYFGNFLEDEPIPGIENEFELTKNLIPTIKLSEVNALASNWITTENRVLTVMMPEKEGVTPPSKDQILSLVEKTDKAPVEAYVDKTSNKPLIAKEPKAGKVVAESKNEKLGTLEWTLSNGVKVVLKQTDFKDDEILFTAYSNGGNSLYPADKMMSASFAAQVAGMSGLGDFENIELEKALAGKMVSVNPYINELQEGLNGNCSKNDFETLLQLTYLSFTAPRVDEKAFGSFTNRMKSMLENAALDPSHALGDTVQVVMSGYSPYRKPVTIERLAEANLTDITTIIRERFANPEDFTFIFVGTIDLTSAKPLIEKYLGGLPTSGKVENWRDLGIRPPKGLVKKAVIRPMQDPKATVYVMMPGYYTYETTDRLALEAVNDILSTRLVETIREEEGGTYGAGVWTNQRKSPEPMYQLNVRFDCDPDNAEKLTGIVLREIEKMRTDGPDEKQVSNVRENKLKTFGEKQRENRFWLSNLNTIYSGNATVSDFIDYETNVKNLTPEMVKKVAAKYYDGNQLVDIKLLPESTENSVKNPNMIRDAK